MIANHIHHALEQVHELQHRILEKQRFRGYSGRARLFSGALALLTAVVLASPYVPRTPQAHLRGWGLLLILGLCINYGAIVYRFVSMQHFKQDVRRLRPVLDTVPPLIIGAVMTVAMLLHGHYEHLFGIWMSLFGLTHLISRHVLPPRVALVGSFYMICGVICLLLPLGSFLNPWPMGLVFFVGEGAGGLLLWLDERSICS